MSRRLLLALLMAAPVTGCRRERSAGSATRPVAPATAIPNDPAAQYQAGKSALERGHYREAIELFGHITGAGGASEELRANAWLGMGAAYAELGDSKAAVGAYQKVTTLRPNDPDAWRVLAEGLDKGGSPEERAAALEHVIALDPDDLGAYLKLAGIDAASGNLDKSKDVYLRYEVRRREAIAQLGKAKDPDDRIAAAEVLGGANDAGTARALLLALTDKEPAVRLACVQSLEQIGVDVDREVRPSLDLIRKRETDPKVRAAIDKALAGFAK